MAVLLSSFCCSGFFKSRLGLVMRCAAWLLLPLLAIAFYLNWLKRAPWDWMAEAFVFLRLGAWNMDALPPRSAFSKKCDVFLSLI